MGRITKLFSRGPTTTSATDSTANTFFKFSKGLSAMTSRQATTRNTTDTDDSTGRSRSVATRLSNSRGGTNTTTAVRGHFTFNCPLDSKMRKTKSHRAMHLDATTLEHVQFQPSFIDLGPKRTRHRETHPVLDGSKSAVLVSTGEVEYSAFGFKGTYKLEGSKDETLYELELYHPDEDLEKKFTGFFKPRQWSMMGELTIDSKNDGGKY